MPAPASASPLHLSTATIQTTSSRAPTPRSTTPSLTGGLPQPMALDRGGFLSYSPDGKQIAYNRIFRDFRT